MIPPLIHFVLLGPMPFDWLHYVAVQTAAEANPGMEIVLWSDGEPSGPWWERARPRVRLEVRAAPSEVAGFPVEHPAHRSDLLRLEVLERHGGIYLDLDVLTVRSYAPLLDAEMVMGGEGIDSSYGLCNAVIMAAPGARLLRSWRAGYDPATSLWQGFRSRGRDEHWNEMSVQYPSMLAAERPDQISVMPFTYFHWPTWEEQHLRLLFEPTFATFPDAYCHHLWATFAWERYLHRVNPERGLARDGSRFAALAGPHLGWSEDAPPLAASHAEQVQA